MKLPYRILLAVLAFLLMAAYWCFIAWCGGFNFDKRGTKTAQIVVFGSLFSGLACAATFDLSRNIKKP